MFKTIASVLFLFLLTGCWSSQELNEVSLVHGVGLDKSDDNIILSMEIIKPGNSKEEGDVGESIVIKNKGETPIEAGRESIRELKRRPFFDHNRLYVISEKLAKENFIEALDITRRDQMFRLNSYLFISEEDPVNILSTPTLYEDLSSSEIVSAFGQNEYLPGYIIVKMYDFFKIMEGPIPNAYIPMIQTIENNGQMMTTLNGTAVINSGKMIGKLNNEETAVLNVFLNEATGGYYVVNVNGQKISVEVKNEKTEIEPILNGDQLKAHITVEIVGTFADNASNKTIDEEFMDNIEKEMSKMLKGNFQKTLNKLQKELITDITGIGLETYRKYPEEWENVKDRWDEVFSNAEVTFNINTNIIHQGLINKNIERIQDRPHHNPYEFKRGHNRGG